MRTMEDVLRIKSEGVAACADLLEPVLAMRRRVPSLQALATKTIVEFSGWVPDDNNGSMFDKASPSIIKAILTAMEVTYCKHNMEEPQWCLFRMLLRAGRFTKVDLTPWHPGPNDYLVLSFVLANCPYVEELSREHNKLDSKRIQTVDSGIVLLKHLRHLRMKSYMFSQQLLESAATNWENIQCLEFGMCHTDFVNLGVRFTERLVQLQELDICLQESYRFELVANRLLELVLLLPSLKTLGCSALSEPGCVHEFAQHFDRLVSTQRPLLLKFICLNRDMAALQRRGQKSFKWPKNLYVRALEADGCLVELLFCVPKKELKALKLFNYSAQHCIWLLPALGANLTHLVLDCLPNRDCERSLDLQQLLALTPKLTDLQLVGEYEIIKTEVSQIAASHFQSWKSFLLLRTNGSVRYVHHDDESRYEDWRDPAELSIFVLMKVFSLYLKGSQPLEVLHIYQGRYLAQTVLTTLQEHPQCGQQLRRLLVFHQSEESTRKAMELAAFLILNAPNLEEVTFYGDRHLSQTEYRWIIDLAWEAGVVFRLKKDIEPQQIPSFRCLVFDDRDLRD